MNTNEHFCTFEFCSTHVTLRCVCVCPYFSTVFSLIFVCFMITWLNKIFFCLPFCGYISYIDICHLSFALSMASPVFIPGYTYWLSRLLDIRSTTGHHWLSPGIPLLALIMNWSRWMIVTPPKIGSFTRTTQLPTSDMHRNVAHLRSRQTISPGSLSRVSLSFWAFPHASVRLSWYTIQTHTGHRSGSR